METIVVIFGTLTFPTIGWDPVTHDVEGNPEIVVNADVGLFDAHTMRLRKLKGTVDPAGIGWNTEPLLKGVAPGAYDIRVRVYDMALNQSEWSEPLRVVIEDKVPPAAPKGLTVFK